MIQWDYLPLSRFFFDTFGFSQLRQARLNLNQELHHRGPGGGLSGGDVGFIGEMSGPDTQWQLYADPSPPLPYTRQQRQEQHNVQTYNQVMGRYPDVDDDDNDLPPPLAFSPDFHTSSPYPPPRAPLAPLRHEGGEQRAGIGSSGGRTAGGQRQLAVLPTPSSLQ